MTKTSFKETFKETLLVLLEMCVACLIVSFTIWLFNIPPTIEAFTLGIASIILNEAITVRRRLAKLGLD